MKEFKAIIQAYNQVDWNRHNAALATVVNVKGSSYRSPGARMLITDDGRWTGSISGGCLEGDALRKARHVMQTKVPMTVTYDTREESNQKLGIGLGCNGVIDVLIEPVDRTCDENPIAVLEEYVSITEPVVLATIVRGEGFVGKKMIVDVNGTRKGNFPSQLQASSAATVAEIFAGGKSNTKHQTIDNTVVEVFFELIEPCITVMIFGGGFDARPVSQLAKSLGWNVAVTDECVAHIAPIFFPEADKLSLCHRDFIDRDFEITPYTACILMSHNYDYDRDVLRKLMKTNASYIGILGPRKRYDKMLDEFVKEKITLTADILNRIHSPIGLDIGAEAPDEIAVAIIAEIQGKFSNRSGGFLKYRQGPIHSREGSSDQVSKQIYLAHADLESSRIANK